MVGVKVVELGMEQAPCDLQIECYNEEVDTLMTQLDQHRLRAVKFFVGSEGGVIFYDKVCHELDLPQANDYTKSAMRRNKFFMQEQIKSDGIRGIKQFRASSTDAGIDWIRENLTYPVIVKPEESSGSTGVTFCPSESDARIALDAQLHNTDK